MTCESSRKALEELGQDARFEDNIGHYNFCSTSASTLLFQFSLSFWNGPFQRRQSHPRHALPNHARTFQLPTRNPSHLLLVIREESVELYGEPSLSIVGPEPPLPPFLNDNSLGDLR